jgi:AcrR family transcriptional regulator
MPAHPRAARGRRATRPSGDDREQAILETATRLLDERPLHEISVDDLARGAGISRPTLYFYFPSKDAVFMTLIERVIVEADTALEAHLDHHDLRPTSLIRHTPVRAYVRVRGGFQFGGSADYPAR